MAYDLMLVVALWLATLFPMVALTNNAVQGALVQSLVFLEMYAFFVFFWLYRGQTLGMLAWRLTIRTDDGTPLTLMRVTMRFFATVLPLLVAALVWRPAGLPAVALCIAAGALGHAWIHIDRKGRSFADWLSGTRIVRVPASSGGPLE